MGRRPGPTRLCGGGQEDRCGRSRGCGGSHDLCALSRAWLGPRAGAGSRSAGNSQQAAAAVERPDHRRGALWRGGARPSAQEPLLYRRGGLPGRGPWRRTGADCGSCPVRGGAGQACGPGARRCQLRGSPALLSGRLFDNRGNRMSPTHANKGGARYRYYVSQAVLQNKPPPSGLVSRVPAAEIEALVVAALRSHLSASSAGEQLPNNDRDLLERHLERGTLTPNHLELRLRQISEPAQAHNPANTSAGRPTASVTTMAVPWTSPVPAAVKGIIHVPAHNTPIRASRREALLIAIAKAHQWIDDLAHGRAASFAVIARREGKVERHIRLLAPLAFVSPRIVSALLDGTAPADLTLTKLARALPYCWAEQERRVGTSAPFHG